MKYVCETIKTSKQCLISLQKDERISREEEWRWGAVSRTLMSLKSGMLNFYKVFTVSGLARVQDGRDAAYVVLSFLCLFPHPHWWFVLRSCFYRLKSWLKRCLIYCPIRDNWDSFSHFSLYKFRIITYRYKENFFLDPLTNGNKFRAMGFN